MEPNAKTNPENQSNQICHLTRVHEKGSSQSYIYTHNFMFDTYSHFIKQLNPNYQLKPMKYGGIEGKMKTNKTLSPQKRKQVQNKIMQALKAEMQTLSTEMQQILCDDLVTAFQNRLIVLAKAKPKHY